MKNVAVLFFTSMLAHAFDARAADLPDAVKAEALETLVSLIRLDTSQPAGNEILAARYLAKRLAADGIDSEQFAPVTGRTSLVARVRGDGSARPLLLLGHTDVVTVERENWSFDPFSGTVANGKVFGRGAVDNKAGVAALTTIMKELARRDLALERDVIFLAVADEEAGGMLGITYMVQNHLSKIAAEFAINEGGRGYIDPESGKYIAFYIGTAEKTPRRARLIAHGRAGHGSVPTRDNAVGRLARAVARLFESPLPMRLNETTRTFFSRLAETRPESEAAIYRRILTEQPDAATEERLRDINPSYFSIIRTSVVPTIISGGYQRNVIPSSAEATLDIRALPGEDPEVLFEALAEIIDDPGIEIVPMAVTRPAHDPAPLGTPLFGAFEEVLGARYPGAVVLPNMLTGATDSAQLRAAGIPAYGFGPGVMLGEDNGVHGNDEYLRVDAFYEYLDILWNVVLETATSPSSSER